MKTARGVTLVELMVGTLVLFVACTAAATVVATCSRFLVTERLRSEMLQVEWQTTQQMSIQTGWASKPPILQPGFSCAIDNNTNFLLDAGWATADPWRMHLLTESIYSPDNTSCNFEMMSPWTAVQQVATPDFSNDPHVYFVGPSHTVPGDTSSSSPIMVYDSTAWLAQLVPWIQAGLPLPAPPAPAVSSTQMPPKGLLPQPAPNPPMRLSAAGLAVSPDESVVYSSDQDSAGWQAYTTGSWTPLNNELLLPNGGGQAGGMALYSTTAPMPTVLPPAQPNAPSQSGMWIVDTSNRSVVHWDMANAFYRLPGPEQASLPGATPGPPQPLVDPLSVAWDTVRSKLWVTDVGNLCLREYDLNLNAWGPPLRFTYPSMPRGVTVDRTEGCVWSADALNIWGYYVYPPFPQSPLGTPPAWYQFPLPPGLQYKVADLHYNDQTNPQLLWIVTTDGQLWTLLHESTTLNIFTQVSPVPGAPGQ